jgi:hypothetical protein
MLIELHFYLITSIKRVIKCYKSSKRKSFIFTVMGLLFFDKMNGGTQGAKVEIRWNKAPEYHCVKLTVS